MPNETTAPQAVVDESERTNIFSLFAGMLALLGLLGVVSGNALYGVIAAGIGVPVSLVACVLSFRGKQRLNRILSFASLAIVVVVLAVLEVEQLL